MEYDNLSDFFLIVNEKWCCYLYGRKYENVWPPRDVALEGNIL